MGDKLPVLSGKDMVRFLEREGFAVKRKRGSHHMLYKDTLCTIIPVHGNKGLNPGTLRAILNDVEIDPKVFRQKLR